MAYSTSTTMSELTVALKGQAALAALDEGVMAPGSIGHQLLAVRRLPKGSKSFQFNYGNTFSAYDVTEGQDHNLSQAYDPTGTAVTATERVAMSTVTDLGRQAVIDNVDQSIGFEIGRALGVKWDTDVFVLNSALGNSEGTTATDLNFVDVMSALNKLRVDKIPGPFWGIFHPVTWQDLCIEGTPTMQTSTGGVGTISEMVQQTYWVQSGILGLAGMVITTNITESTDYYNVIMSATRPCYGCVIMEHPDTPGQLWNNHIALERDESARAYEVVGTSCFGVAEIEDNAGCYLLGDVN